MAEMETEDLDLCGIRAAGPSGFAMPDRKDPFTLQLFEPMTCPRCGGTFTQWHVSDSMFCHQASGTPSGGG